MAYFHRPEELRDELLAAGFGSVELVAIEGPGAFQNGVDLSDAAVCAAVLRGIERVDGEASLLGASSHLMASASADPPYHARPAGRGRASRSWRF